MANSDKPVIWMGTSKKDLKEMHDDVQDAIGFALDKVQKGLPHSNIKSLSGNEFKDVHEIRVNYDTDTYRAVYVINLGNRIFMLHVFKKKSKKGEETPKPNMNVIKERLKRAKILAKELDDEQRKH